METTQQHSSSSHTKHSENSYGVFLVKLAELFTLRIALDLATYFNFPTARYDELQRAEYPGQLLVSSMQERGCIYFNDISPLTKALDDLNLVGVKNDVLSQFKIHTSNNVVVIGKLKSLQDGLKAAYRRFYKSVQPIPYIIGKVYSVDDLFVESGIQLVNVRGKAPPYRTAAGDTTETENVQLKSYRDLFDINIVSSNRIIVQGEPGYGKSTITYKAVHDWCNSRSFLPLGGIELFILLQFRLLRGIKSIYEAIKRTALPRDCALTEKDIEEILASCTRVVLVLDGFDECPQMEGGFRYDVMEIIKGNMFLEQRVVIFTRTGCLPRNIDPETLFARLTGFDDPARDKYMRKIAVGISNDFANEMKHHVEKNPIMSDLSQLPLFFVMFAHLATESEDILTCDSLTNFFNCVIRCFYNHMWEKTYEGKEHDRYYMETADKSALCKLAFEGLTGNKQTLVWQRKEVFDKAGKTCCEELMKVGILVEEELMNDLYDTPGLDHIPYKHVIRFYHKVFAEWYAAHHVAELAKNFSFFRRRRLGTLLQRIDPQDVQFVFRFTCGLNPITFTSIFKYLSGFSHEVAILCILETASNLDDTKGIVKDILSKTMTFNSSQSRLLQRSTIQLLTLASKKQIPISCVRLDGCFKSVDLKDESLCLSTGLKLPRLDTLQKLVIFGGGYLREGFSDILDYSARCESLKTLKFASPEKSRYLSFLLPESFDVTDVLISLRGKKCQVQWNARGVGLVNLNLQTGKWQLKDGKEMTDDEYHRVDLLSLG